MLGKLLMRSVISFFLSNARLCTKAQCGRGGFTLVEGLVVIAIIVLISTMVLGNHRSYGSSVRMRGILEDMVASFRQAQVYGTAVRGVEGGSYDRVYGLNFDPSRSSSYMLWTEERGGDRMYDASAVPSENVTGGVFQLPGGFTIARVTYGDLSAGDDTCASGGVWSTPYNFLFIRPSTDIELFEQTSGVRKNEGEYNYACIEVNGPNSTVGFVKVYRTGYAYGTLN